MLLLLLDENEQPCRFKDETEKQATDEESIEQQHKHTTQKKMYIEKVSIIIIRCLFDLRTLCALSCGARFGLSFSAIWFTCYSSLFISIRPRRPRSILPRKIYGTLKIYNNLFVWFETICRVCISRTQWTDVRHRSSSNLRIRKRKRSKRKCNKCKQIYGIWLRQI